MESEQLSNAPPHCLTIRSRRPLLTSSPNGFFSPETKDAAVLLTEQTKTASPGDISPKVNANDTYKSRKRKASHILAPEDDDTRKLHQPSVEYGGTNHNLNAKSLSAPSRPSDFTHPSPGSQLIGTVTIFDRAPTSDYGSDTDNASTTSISTDENIATTVGLRERVYRRRYTESERMLLEHTGPGHTPEGALSKTDWNLFPADTLHACQCNIYHELSADAIELHHTLIEPDVKTILILGARTGIWASRMKNKFSAARVVAVEVVQFEDQALVLNPENRRYDYQIEDPCIAVRTMKETTYDFIYIDRKAGIYTRKQWIAIYKNVFRILRPGGTLVHAEMSWDQLASDSCTAVHWKHYLTVCDHWAKETGQPYNIDSEIDSWMTKTGFEDIQQEQFCLPSEAVASDVEGLIRGPFTLYDISEEKIGIGTCRMEIEAMEGKCPIFVRHVWGRKPWASPSAAPTV